MPRVLVLYDTAEDRLIAARTATALVHRGVDVDVTPSTATRRLPRHTYQRVVRAADQDPARLLRFPRASHEGEIRIVGASDEPAPREDARLAVALFAVAILVVALLAFA
jgi:hypothetical protein